MITIRINTCAHDIAIDLKASACAAQFIAVDVSASNLSSSATLTSLHDIAMTPTHRS
jgi:hypothetical protein